MVPVLSLWMPILLSAVLVFVASSIIHMVLTYHRADIRKLPAQDEVMEALRKFSLPPGDYMMPFAGTSQEMKAADFVERRKKGPVAFMTVMASGEPAMGASLAQWFLYCLVVGVFAAYVAGRALGPGVEYLKVFRFAGATAFVGYSLALVQNSIWMKRAWGATLRLMFDGLLYGLLTAGAFGWLWPR
ncbi:MAG TPA: hypothetical protein VGK93_09785 [Candidatus Eisenbacteria bacterium]|jgi:Flp pilus assembly protein TadB